MPGGTSQYKWSACRSIFQGTYQDSVEGKVGQITFQTKKLNVDAKEEKIDRKKEKVRRTKIKKKREKGPWPRRQDITGTPIYLSICINLLQRSEGLISRTVGQELNSIKCEKQYKIIINKILSFFPLKRKFHRDYNLVEANCNSSFVWMDPPIELSNRGKSQLDSSSAFLICYSNSWKLLMEVSESNLASYNECDKYLGRYYLIENY